MSLTRNKQLQYPLSGSFTGSLFGTASYALTASYVSNTGSFFLIGGNFSNSSLSLGTLNDYSLFLIVSGSNRIQINNTGSIFIIKNQTQKNVLSIQDSGLVSFLTQSSEPSGTPNLGDLYFTTGSLYVGLD